MARAFSRRSFLKYTAVAAVAVAGSSLLTGCEHGDNPVQTEIGTTNTVLKIKTKLDKASYDSDKAQLDFQLTIYNGRTNPVNLNKNCFVITVGNYCADESQNLDLKFHEGESTDEVDYVYGPTVSNKKTTTLTVSARNLPESVLQGETVALTYFPEPGKYNEYSASWMLNADALG